LYTYLSNLFYVILKKFLVNKKIATYFPGRMRHISPIASQKMRPPVSARFLPAADSQVPHTANVDRLLNNLFHMQACRHHSVRPPAAQLPFAELTLDNGGAN
jgi:hypothetical protein